MSGDREVAEIVTTAAASGVVARVLMALHFGERRWVILLIEAGLGGVFGAMAAGGMSLFFPELAGKNRELLIIGAAAGLSGALGNKVLDHIVNLISKK